MTEPAETWDSIHLWVFCLCTCTLPLSSCDQVQLYVEKLDLTLLRTVKLSKLQRLLYRSIARFPSYFFHFELSDMPLAHLMATTSFP